MNVKFAELIWIDDLCPRSAALNMAVDEVLLMQLGQIPVFRTYRWESKSLSFGYFAKWESLHQQYHDRDLVRRWTGGGAVEHGDDFTYSLIITSPGTLFKARTLYHSLHLTIAEVFREHERPAALSSVIGDGPSLNCFDRPVEHDVTSGGAKIAGAAIRRLRGRLLLQGSIQRTDLWPDLGARMAEKLGEVVRTQAVLPELIEAAMRVAEEKYATDAWTRRF